MSKQPIKLTMGEGEAMRRLSHFIGRHCDTLLDGEALDRERIFAADEGAGAALLLKYKGPAGTFKTYEYDRIANRPVLEKRTGKVEIRLHESAPPAVRNAYLALRRGDWMQALAVMDADDAARKTADREEEAP